MLRALYDFESTIPQTINFSKGDFFVLHPSVNKQRNWWHVITATGQVGYVPNNYVQTVEVSLAVIHVPPQLFEIINVMGENKFTALFQPASAGIFSTDFPTQSADHSKS